MVIFTVYFLLILIAAGSGLIAIFNFLRYRFKGDLTYFFILIFGLAFFITIGTTFLLLNTSGFSPSEVITPVFE